MEASHYDHLLSDALSGLSGEQGIKILIDFSAQIGFLKEMCKTCLVGCRGYKGNCPFPGAWPDEIILCGPTNERVFLEGQMLGTEKHIGKVAGCLIIKDEKENKIYSRTCMIDLPYDH